MSTWWVNQGRTFEAEVPRGYLFAPFRDRRGGPVEHWETMTQLRLGELVLHYAAGKIRATSRVTETATEATRPVPLPEPWLNTGWIARVQPVQLDRPIALDEIPIDLRLALPRGPFDRTGRVRQVYLLPVSRQFAGGFAARFAGRLPASVTYG